MSVKGMEYQENENLYLSGHPAKTNKNRNLPAIKTSLSASIFFFYLLNCGERWTSAACLNLL